MSKLQITRFVANVDTERFTDLDKLKLVKFACGGLVFDLSQFSLTL